MSETRELILRSLDRIVEDTLDVNARIAADGSAGWPERLWAELEQQGMTGIGGDGEIAFADVMALVARSAYHTIPVPLAETVLARRLLARAGIDAPDGPMTVAPPGAAQLAFADGRLASSAAAVPWGRDVRHMVLAVDGQLILANAEKAATGRTFSIAGEPRDAINAAEAKLIGKSSLAEAPRIVEAEGALLRAVQMRGALSRTLEHCLTWVNDRIQFGKPIAKFQAIQHLMAQLAAEVAAAGAAVDLAVEASAETPDRFSIGIAKARAGEAAGKAAAMAHQMFGAMGFTREHALHYATRRLWSWRDEFGGEAFWQAEIGRLVARQGADALWPMLTERG